MAHGLLSSFAGKLLLQALAFGGLGRAVADSPQCRPFREIYSDGKQLCEQMWGDAFRYDSDEHRAYTMWFDGQANPNNVVTERLGRQVPDICLIQYFHRDVPAKVASFLKPNACPPWKHHGCCRAESVASSGILKGAYGSGYEWDRCGPMSAECEQFFVSEACFYECEPSVGLFRKFPEEVYDPRCDKRASLYNVSFAAEVGCRHNSWEIKGMPIKASFCDNWLTACEDDLFCASDNGNFFSCAAKWTAHDAEL